MAKENSPLKGGVLKSLILLWKLVADDYATRCRTSTTMDYKLVQGRSKHEGLSFLTISLPTFGRDFQKGLNLGLVDRNSFQGFSWRAGLPQFLGGFLDLIFDRNSGVLLDKPDIDAILAVRQLTLMFGKTLLPCSDARVAKAMSEYVECDLEVGARDDCMISSDIEDFKRVARVLFSSMFSKVDSDVYHGNIVPKHGPGSTADKLLGNKKFLQRTWTSRLESVFPFGEFLFPSWSYYSEFDSVDLLEPGEELPVRVIPVPKTQKTPRIIAIEPTAMQYAQQGLLESILTHIEGDDYLNMFLGFRDQSPNQQLAQKGSLTGDLATLDLSDASDRVSFRLVMEMVSCHPHLQRALDATRSRKADVPGQGVVSLSKFASMGSATTFPIEAMVFLTCVFLGIERSLNTRCSPSLLKEMKGKVRIYGDDIIAPMDHVHSIVDTLELFGAKVGLDKSFWIGRFRESCGKEYYEGHDVSIVKVRRLFPTQLKCVPEVISLVSLRNQLYKAGCWKAVKWLDRRIRDLLIHFPNVHDTSPVLGRFSFLGYETQREHKHLHSPLVKGYVVVSQPPIDKLDGPGALLKFFLKRGSQPAADRKHLERAGRPRAVDIKPRWASPF